MLALFGAASPAQAHDQLLESKIVAAASGEPSAIRLSYSGNILGVGNEVQVTDAKGASVTKGEPTVLNRDLTQNLATPLADGKYTGLWHVVSSDGHAIEGAFEFTVANGVAGEVTAVSMPSGGSAQTPADEGDSGEDASRMPTAQIVAIVGVIVIAGAAAFPLLRRKKNRE